MRVLFCLLLLLCCAAAAARAQPSGQRFISIAFHDIQDNPADLDSDSVTTTRLAQFLDWVKGSGWTAVSLDDVAAAHRGARPLPDKSILISFDDGYHSLYTHVFPLLKVYRFPVVAALVGSWMETRPDGKVQYGDRIVPRSDFISWEEARQMQASSLVEFASHSYSLHQGVQANPQGNMIPAAITWRYDPASRHYEDDAEYRARIRADLARSRAQMAANLGRAPRALVWPFGRFSGPALDIAKGLGFTFALTLEPEPAYTSNLFAIHRYFPSRNPSLGDIVRNLRFEPGMPTTRRIACLKIDEMAAVQPGAAQDEALGRMIDGVRALGANTVVIDANAALPSPGAALGEVFFPTSLRPLKADILSRATWQIRSRGGADVFLRIPLESAAATLGQEKVPALFADMVRYTAGDGIALNISVAGQISSIMPDLVGDVRARRAALDPATLDDRTRFGLRAFRAAAALDYRQRLMIDLPEGAGPPDWADIGMLPSSRDAPAMAVLANQMRAEGWLRPDAAGRLAFELPPGDPGRKIEAMRQAQRQGASAFALCPEAPALPPVRALSAAFSAATYPYRP